MYVCMCVCSHHSSPFWGESGGPGQARRRCSKSSYWTSPSHSLLLSLTSRGQLMVEIKNVLIPIFPLPQGERWVCPTFLPEIHRACGASGSGSA